MLANGERSFEVPVRARRSVLGFTNFVQVLELGPTRGEARVPAKLR